MPLACVTVSGGTIEYWDSISEDFEDTGVLYSVNVPQTFKVVMDFATHKFDLYIADSWNEFYRPVVYDQDFQISTTNDINFFTFIDSKSGETYGLDDIKIFPGGTLYVAPEDNPDACNELWWRH